MEKPAVIVLGPARSAVSGVATHVDLIFKSKLARDFTLIHFQVGSEGRRETAAGRVMRLLASPLALAWRVLICGAAVVHVNTSLNRRAWWRDLAYAIVARLCGARVLCQVHGGDLPEKFAGGALRAALLRASLMLPDVVAVLAQAELAAYRAFVPAQAVVVLPNGIDLAPYATLQRPAATALRLVYIGRLAKDKGLFETLRALARVRAQGIDARLTLAGSGPDELSLRDLARSLYLGDRVRFAGPVFGADKLALLARSDALLLPTYAEGMPYALLECMAAGVPAIATRVGAIPDVMVEGVHGLFVEPRDDAAIAQAIVRLADDRALLATMSAACRRRAAHSYSIDRLADDLALLYAEVIARRRWGLQGKS